MTASEFNALVDKLLQDRGKGEKAFGPQMGANAPIDFGQCSIVTHGRCIYLSVPTHNRTNEQIRADIAAILSRAGQPHIPI